MFFHLFMANQYQTMNAEVGGWDKVGLVLSKMWSIEIL